MSAQFQLNVGSTLMLLCLSGNAAGGRYFFDVFIQFCSRLSSFFFSRRLQLDFTFAATVVQENGHLEI